MRTFAVGLCSLVALGVLGYGVVEANPLVYFSTPEERAELLRGRVWATAAAAAVLLAAVALGVVGARAAALLTAVLALACGPLLYAAPGAAYALVAFLVLAPIALGTLFGAVVRAAREAV